MVRDLWEAFIDSVRLLAQVQAVITFLAVLMIAVLTGLGLHTDERSLTYWIAAAAAIAIVALTVLSWISAKLIEFGVLKLPPDPRDPTVHVDSDGRRYWRYVLPPLDLPGGFSPRAMLKALGVREWRSVWCRATISGNAAVLDIDARARRLPHSRVDRLTSVAVLKAQDRINRHGVS